LGDSVLCEVIPHEPANAGEPLKFQEQVVAHSRFRETTDAVRSRGGDDGCELRR
jgi:hypothetical protein